MGMCRYLYDMLPAYGQTTLNDANSSSVMLDCCASVHSSFTRGSTKLRCRGCCSCCSVISFRLPKLCFSSLCIFFIAACLSRKFTFFVKESPVSWTKFSTELSSSATRTGKPRSNQCLNKDDRGILT